MNRSKIYIFQIGGKPKGRNHFRFVSSVLLGHQVMRGTPLLERIFSDFLNDFLGFKGAR